MAFYPARKPQAPGLATRDHSLLRQARSVDRPLPCTSSVTLAKTKHLTLAAKRALKARQANTQRTAKDRQSAGLPQGAQVHHTQANGSGTGTGLHQHGTGVTSKVKLVASSRTSSIHLSKSKPTSRIQSRQASPSAGAVGLAFAERSTIVGQLTATKARQPYPSPSPSQATLSPDQPLMAVLAPDPQYAQQQQQQQQHRYREEDDRGRSTTPRLLWRSQLQEGTADALDEYVQVRFGQPGIPVMTCSGEKKAGRRRRPTETEADEWAKQLATTGL